MAAAKHGTVGEGYQKLALLAQDKFGQAQKRPSMLWIRIRGAADFGEKVLLGG